MWHYFKFFFCWKYSSFTVGDYKLLLFLSLYDRLVYLSLFVVGRWLT